MMKRKLDTDKLIPTQRQMKEKLMMQKVTQQLTMNMITHAIPIKTKNKHQTATQNLIATQTKTVIQTAIQTRMQENIHLLNQ